MSADLELAPTPSTTPSPFPSPAPQTAVTPGSPLVPPTATKSPLSPPTDNNSNSSSGNSNGGGGCRVEIAEDRQHLKPADSASHDHHQDGATGVVISHRPHSSVWLHYNLLRQHLHFPHIHYRRLYHHFFDHFHIYHPSFLPKGTAIATAFNIATATIGGGTISMPYSAQSSGIALFVLYCVVIWILTCYSIKLLCRNAELLGVHSFEVMTRKVFRSHKLEILVEALLIINCFGCAIAYIVVIGDIGEAFAKLTTKSAKSISERRLLAQTILFLCVMLPLSLLRSLNALKYASIVGIAAISALVIAVVVSGARHGTTDHLHVAFQSNAVHMLNALPVVIFGFSNQVNVIEIYSEMPKRSPSSIFRISAVVTGVIGMVYIAVSLFSIAEFSFPQGNLLNNYTVGSDVLITIAFVGFAVKTMLTFPLLVFPTREAFFHLTGVEDLRTVTKTRWYIITIIIGCASFGLAYVVPQVVTLFGLIGSICASSFSFILPAALALWNSDYWVQRKEEESKTTDESHIPVGNPSCLEKPLCWMMLLFGFIVAIGGTILSIQSMTK